jgi:2'-5' RNA ligase
MRLFTGLDLPAHVSASLENLLETLRPMARVRWSPVDNLHITTKFIGDWPPDRLREMRSALARVAGREPIPVAVRGLGWKPTPRNPRLFWAGVEAPLLGDLAHDIDNALLNLDVAPEHRPYNPHLTLARIGKPVPLEAVLKRIAGLPSTNFGSFEADRFYLYDSKPGPRGSVYTKLAEFPFAR